jgi:hypothetical protein
VRRPITWALAAGPAIGVADANAAIGPLLAERGIAHHVDGDAVLVARDAAGGVALRLMAAA